MKKFLFIFYFFCIFFNFLFARAESFNICPLCLTDGVITCPDGYEPACPEEELKPKCVFYEKRYVPGCLQFIGLKKIDLGYLKFNLPSSYMVQIVGGGETFTLNREIIGCKLIKL